MSLKASEQKLSGSFELRLQTEDAPEIISGEAHVSTREQDVEIAVTGKSGKLQARAKLSKAGRYAIAAMYGVIDPAPEAGFGGGVWIAWLFKSRQG